MLIDTLCISSRFLYRSVFYRIVSKSALVFPAFIMDSRQAKVKELNLLFKRLQDAKKDADNLKQELINIKSELEAAENLPIFKSCLVFSHRASPEPGRDSPDDNDYNENGDIPAPKRAKYEFPKEDGYVVVYTDGACENNGTKNAKAGIGVWFAPNHPFNVSEPVSGKATNNAAEIQACIAAVKIARENDIKKLKIITDSQFTINSMTKWIKGWKKKGWKLADGKSDVKNKTDFQKLDALSQELDIKWEHVSGHSGIVGNESADKLARDGAKQYRPEL